MYYKAVEGLGALQELLKHFSKISPVFAAELELATRGEAPLGLAGVDKTELARCAIQQGRGLIMITLRISSQYACCSSNFYSGVKMTL